MIEIMKKAWWLVGSRPALFAATLRQYFLFARTRVLGRWFFTEQQGIYLSDNVRVQRISCLSAERPDARIEIGRDSIVYENARIQSYGRGQISIGATSIIGDARIYSRSAVRIGERVVTSWNVFIQDFDAHPIDPALRAAQMHVMCGGFKPSYRTVEALPALNWDFPVAPIEIGNDVWIGANVTILKGAKIGDGCVIATGAVVPAGEWPARSVLAGVPARVVKTL